MTLPIVLLPGMHGTTELMAGLKRKLAESREVIAIDYPAQMPLGYQELSEIVKRRLPRGRCVVLGESFSGPLSISIAHELPENVGGLVLASTFARAPLPPALARVVPFIDHNWLPYWFLESALFGSFEAPETRAEVRRLLAEMPPAVFRRRAIEALRIDKTAELAAIGCPVLCLFGSGDWLLGRRGRAQFRAASPGAEFVEIEASHLVLATHPDEAAVAIDGFCARIRR